MKLSGNKKVFCIFKFLPFSIYGIYPIDFINNFTLFDLWWFNFTDMFYSKVITFYTDYLLILL